MVLQFPEEQRKEHASEDGTEAVRSNPLLQELEQVSIWQGQSASAQNTGVLAACRQLEIDECSSTFCDAL